MGRKCRCGTYEKETGIALSAKDRHIISGADVRLEGDAVVIAERHVEGQGPGTAGISVLRQTARRVMEHFDVCEFRVEGAGAPQGRDRAVFPGPSVSGVDLRIAWDGRSALRKVRLTQIVRDGGVRLRDAARVTTRVVDGEVLDLHLPHYANTQDVAAGLRAVGVAVTESASPERAVSS